MGKKYPCAEIKKQASSLKIQLFVNTIKNIKTFCQAKVCFNFITNVTVFRFSAVCPHTNIDTSQQKGVFHEKETRNVWRGKKEGVPLQRQKQRTPTEGCRTKDADLLRQNGESGDGGREGQQDGKAYKGRPSKEDKKGARPS